VNVCRNDILLVLVSAAGSQAAIREAERRARAEGGSLHVMVAHTSWARWTSPWLQLAGFSPTESVDQILRRMVLACLPSDHGPVNIACIERSRDIAPAVEGRLGEESVSEVRVGVSTDERAKSRRLVDQLRTISESFDVRISLQASYA
jgi:hypothetical protein